MRKEYLGSPSRTNSNPKPNFDLALLDQSELDNRLIQAVESEDLAACFELLEVGADPNAKKGFRPLLFVLIEQSDNVEIAELLINKGADLEMRLDTQEFYDLIHSIPYHDQSPIMTAAMLGREKLVSLFIKRNAVVNALQNAANIVQWYSGYHALMLASMYGNTSCVRLLLEAGAEVNAENAFDETALTYTAFFGHVDCMQLLLKAGASANVKDHDNTSALYHASMNGRVEVVRLLLEPQYLVDLDTRCDISLTTPLGAAAASGHLEIVEMLLDRGADVSCGYLEGTTALLNAGSMGHLPVVRLLLAQDRVPEQIGFLSIQNISNLVAYKPYFLDFIEYLYKCGIEIDEGITTRLIEVLDNIEASCDRLLAAARNSLPAGKDLHEHVLDSVGAEDRASVEKWLSEDHIAKSERIRALFSTYSGRRFARILPNLSSVKENVLSRYATVLAAHKSMFLPLLKSIYVDIVIACKNGKLPFLPAEVVELIISMLLPTYRRATGLLTLPGIVDGKFSDAETIRLVAPGTLVDCHPPIRFFERMMPYCKATKGWVLPSYGQNLGL